MQTTHSDPQTSLPQAGFTALTFSHINIFGLGANDWKACCVNRMAAVCDPETTLSSKVQAEVLHDLADTLGRRGLPDSVGRQAYTALETETNSQVRAGLVKCFFKSTELGPYGDHIGIATTRAPNTTGFDEARGLAMDGIAAVATRSDAVEDALMGIIEADVSPVAVERAGRALGRYARTNDISGATVERLTGIETFDHNTDQAATEIQLARANASVEVLSGARTRMSEELR